MEKITYNSPITIAEMRLINALILNRENFVEVDREVFLHQTFKDVYDAIKSLNDEGIPLTPQSVFQDSSTRNVNVSYEAVQQCFSINEDKDVVIKDMLSLLHDSGQSLKALDKIEEIKKLIADNPRRSDELNDKIKSMLYESEALLVPLVNKKRIETFEDVEKNYLENLESRKNGKQYKFGDPVLDRAVKYGPAPGSGGLIAAATGMGKSAFCLNLINRLLDTRVPVMYYSLEMGEMDTFDRLMSLRAKIDMEHIVNPEDKETFEMVKDEVKAQFNVLKENPFFRFSESANVSLSQIHQDVQKFQMDIGQTYCVVVFDLLSMVKEFMAIDKNGLNFAQSIEVAINKLNAMSKELGIHYMGVLQFNRKSEDGYVDDMEDIKRFRPTRNQIKNSGAFLERCRYALGLFRPRYYAEMLLEDKSLWEDEPDVVEVSMLKQNQGEVGIIGKYMFDPSCMKMDPMSEAEENN